MDHKVLAFSLVCGLVSGAASADVYEFDIAKFRIYAQIDSVSPVVSIAFGVNAYIDTDPGDAAAASVDGIPLSEEDPGQWNYEAGFLSQAALDAAFPPGSTYTINMSGGTLGTRSQQVTLFTPEVYPTPAAFTPTSFDAIQAADAGQDLVLAWGAPDASTNLVSVSVYTTTPETLVIDSGDMSPGQTSFTVPAGTLSPGETYQVEIVFGNVQLGAGTPTPGFGTDADKLTGYGSVTATQFATNGGVACPADFAAPFGVLNFFDIQAFITLYNAHDSAADLAAPFGVYNFFDIQAYITQFNNGCP